MVVRDIRPGPAEVKWWAGLPAVSMQLETESGPHDIVWSDGLLSSPQHGDAESERTMVALGATRCSCLDVFEGWTDHQRDPAVLAIGARSRADAVALEIAAFDALKARADGWRRSVANTVAQSRQLANVDPRTLEAIARPADERVRRRLAFLYLWTLPADFLQRLQATVVADLVESWPASEPALSVALTSRVRAAGVVGGRSISTAAPGSAPVVTTDKVVLPVDWLQTVWAREAAVIGGHLVISVADVAADGRQMTAVIEGTGNARVEYVVDEWENHWRPIISRS